MNKRFRMPLLLLAAATIGGCGGAASDSGNGVTNPTGGTGGTNPSSNTNVIAVSDNTFSPGQINVPAGIKVNWNWTPCSDGGGYGGSGACVSHQITFDDGSNLSSPMQSTGTYTRTFTAPGTYKYHCSVHGAGMSGVVVVQ